MQHFFFLSLLPLMLLGNQGNDWRSGKSGMEAARLMEQGKTEEALNIFENLASKGDNRAMVQLGIYYYEGTGVQKDYEKAMDWWLKAFANQNADAFVNLGVMHRDGNSVPKNKKIAYCVFLTTHMSGLGSESTQYRANNCLRRIMEELSIDDIKDCLSNYTLKYITAYLEAKGQMKGIPDQFKPSKGNPALKDTGWWLDSELDAIYGPPTEEVKNQREERDKQISSLMHLLVVQIKFSSDSEKRFHAYSVITDEGAGGGPVSEHNLQKLDNDIIFENESVIYVNQHRYVTVKYGKNDSLVFKIDHPVKPSPSDWSEWQKADYIMTDWRDEFALMNGREPKSKNPDVPSNMPILRFKVLKK